jgi:pantoate--beta-alanine ligase
VEKLSDIMCGKSRPSHFKGVATVCTKLFNIAKPDIAYFGQKDYQQATIIQRMAQDLNMGLKVKIMPIVREKNGLAMSSRNVYLTPQQKEDAAILYKSLKKAKPLIKKGEHSALKIKALIRNMILEKPQTKIDYIAIKDPKTLKDKKAIDSAILIAIAVWVGKTRLIDNIKVPGTLKGGRRQC